MTRAIMCFFFSFSFLVNGYEYITMWYIISTQKDRDVNEILHDFNAETLDNDISGLHYRKREITLKKCMAAGAVITFLWLLVGWSITIVKEPAAFRSIYVIKFAIMGLNIVFFFLLMWNMYKQHYFEYERVKVQLTIHFVCSLIYLCTFILANMLLGEASQSCLEDYFISLNVCFNEYFNDLKVKFVIIRALYFICNFIQFEELLMIFCGVYLKSSKCILQGLNKLDYLIKYSVFQVYKRDLIND